MKEINLLIVDDHLLFSEALNGLISAYDEFNVLKVLTNGKELIEYLSNKNTVPENDF